jgi:hypothetical protein
MSSVVLKTWWTADVVSVESCCGGQAGSGRVECHLTTANLHAVRHDVFPSPLA